MIKAIAIDDEKNALGIIQEFSSRIPDLQLIESFTDPTKALNYLTKIQQPDLIFLDIQMTKMNGLVLAQYADARKTRIILTTAYPDYALQGFELDVADYLLKPFSFQRFERAIQKARVLFKIQDPDSDKVTSNKLSPAPDDFIFIRTDYKTQKINLADIRYIEGSGNYVTLHTIKAKIMVLQNMKKFEEQLMPYQFIRVHKSYIISLHHIDHIEKNFVRIGDVEIPIGESYKDPFLKFLSDNFKQF